MAFAPSSSAPVHDPARRGDRHPVARSTASRRVRPGAPGIHGEDTIMNSTLTAPRRHDHPPDTHADLRPLTPLDRAALHLGLALIRWGRRPGPRPEAERRANRLERALALQERNRLAQEAQQTLLPYTLSR